MFHLKGDHSWGHANENHNPQTIFFWTTEELEWVRNIHFDLMTESNPLSI